jgi:predicted O-methyltransferase YrrM
MLSFDHFLQNRPALHTWDGGRTYNAGGVGVDTLCCFRDLLAQIEQPPSVLETGAGASTIAFLLLGCSPVTTICPEQQLWSRLKEYLAENDVPAAGLREVVDYSEFALPKICSDFRERGEMIDFGLIDGSHQYPTVFIDFCYMNAVLKEAGWLVVDDVQLHPPKELARFLVRSSDYKLEVDLKKSLVFRKTTNRPLVNGWSSYVTEMTERYGRQANPYGLF